MRPILIAAVATGCLGFANATYAQAAHPPADRSAMLASRVDATDVPKTAEFYKAAFGMQETQRISRPDLMEIVLNFGATVEEAKAATTPKLVLITRPAGASPPRITNLIFTVSDVDAVTKRVLEAGGRIDRPPVRSAAGVFVFVRDPAGNGIELIARKPATP
ncbi:MULTISPECIES: VOC family protein [unclassified Phenylobacterium]|uniref:VOC family protein n=1 Tax=unclassified Phenylobacterium TaxID=2640670 RepID=UPI00083A2751|nr:MULTISPECIES: VOC family protein [unclassified Phenylobacterium]